MGYIDYSKRLNGSNTTTLINKEVKQNIENMMNLVKCILDTNNQYDRIVASFLDVIRNYPNSDVRLVTSDINLQNKMEFAELPFIGPPEKEQ